jgi:hypothetical protein
MGTAPLFSATVSSYEQPDATVKIHKTGRRVNPFVHPVSRLMFEKAALQEKKGTDDDLSPFLSWRFFTRRQNTAG